ASPWRSWSPRAVSSSIVIISAIRWAAPSSPSWWRSPCSIFSRSGARASLRPRAGSIEQAATDRVASSLSGRGGGRMGKLQYLDIAKAGYRLVGFNWQSMVRLGLVPFAVILAVALINAILAQAAGTSAAGGNVGAAAGLGFLSLLLNIVSLAAIVPFLVAWHRFTFDVADKRLPQARLALT